MSAPASLGFLFRLSIGPWFASVSVEVNVSCARLSAVVIVDAAVDVIAPTAKLVKVPTLVIAVCAA